MTQYATRLISFLPLAFVVACGGADDGGTGGGMVQIDPPEFTFDFGQAGDDTGTGAECGPTTLCERSILDCSANLTQDACEAWYDAPDSCLDMDAYVDCNCDCEANNAECDGYFTCGEFCFATHC